MTAPPCRNRAGVGRRRTAAHRDRLRGDRPAPRAAASSPSRARRRSTRSAPVAGGRPARARGPPSGLGAPGCGRPCPLRRTHRRGSARASSRSAPGNRPNSASARLASPTARKPSVRRPAPASAVISCRQRSSRCGWAVAARRSRVMSSPARSAAITASAHSSSALATSSAAAAAAGIAHTSSATSSRGRPRTRSKGLIDELGGRLRIEGPRRGDRVTPGRRRRPGRRRG